MLYVLYGADFKKRIAKRAELVDFFLKKKPDTAVINVAPETFSKYDLDELSLSQGIFERKNIVILNGLLEDKELREAVLGKIEVLAESENIFIVSERELLISTRKVLKENAEKIQEFASKEKYRPDFNIFTLADAVGARDKRAAWATLLKALKNGLEPEEIHGTIFWQIKNMLLVKDASGTIAEEAGMKPFVFSKAKRFSGNYSGDELRGFSSRLVSLYHDSHRGIIDFSLGLEKLILETL